MSPSVLAFFSLGFLTPSTIDDPVGVGSSVRELTRRETTSHFEIFYRPASRAGGEVDRIAWRVEEEYRTILESLALQDRVDESGPFHLFVYDTVEDLLRTTGTAGNGGFSTARESHVPYDNDQTRMHEMVHIVIAAVESTGNEPRNMFFAEGIANAVLRFVHGVPVHAVAAYEKRRGTLPPLTTLMTADFYGFLQRNPGFNGYDIGGSFFRFLLDTYGPKKTVDFYMGSRIEKSLRDSLEKVEKRWLEFLDSVKVRPELEALLAERRGDPIPESSGGSPAPALGPEILGPDSAWQAFAADLAVDASPGFQRQKQGISGHSTSAGDWSLCEAKTLSYRQCMIRGTLHADGPCWGVQLRVGDQLQAMVLGNGVFVYFQQQGGVAFTDRFKLTADQPLDLLFIVRDGAQELWIDGRRLLEAEMPAAQGPIGIGVVNGEAVFRDLKVRSLD